jgi:pullulanase/glycogen debranching enzyme
MTWLRTTKNTTRPTSKATVMEQTIIAAGTVESRGRAATPEIERLRNRQVKNFMTATLLSLGVPMFVMGDEVRRTQRGNNNAYCQDNEVGLTGPCSRNMRMYIGS